MGASADRHALREALARAEAERDAARAERDILLAEHVIENDLMHAAEARARAAEAESTRLKETVEAAATRFEDIAAGRAFQPQLHAATGATEARSVLATSPPKENP